MTWFIIGMAILVAGALFGMMGVGAAARSLSKGVDSDMTGLNHRSADLVATLRSIRETQENLAARAENLELILEEDLPRIAPVKRGPFLELPEEQEDDQIASRQKDRDRSRS